MATDAVPLPGPEALAAEVDHATERLIRTASLLSDSDVAQPSMLPGWTRGHVLAHLSRQADSLVNLLTWARTGIETPQYASQQSRDADIANGAGRDIRTQVDDLVGSAARLAAAVAAMPAESWANRVRWRGGVERPAADVPWARLVEVEVHHADLVAGYSAADSPSWFTARFLTELVAHFTERPGRAPILLRADDLGTTHHVGAGSPTTTVHGTAAALTTWLSGRGDGDGLTTTPAGTPLPSLPNWK